MDAPQWPQGIGFVKPMESSKGVLERKVRPQKEQAVNCPRCNSTNTKFCYYNNYSLTQPRYFCKTCRRYWTEGGSLRNVPVGGGSRKKRSSTAAASTTPTTSSSKKLCDQNPSSFPQQNPQNPKTHQGQDLNLAFPPPHEDYSNISEFVEAPFSDNTTNPNSSRGFMMSSFMPMPILHPNPSYSSGFSLHEFKPTLNFTLDHGFEESNARLLFPFEDLKNVSATTEFEQNRAQPDSSGYWNGMLGGGSW